MPACIHVVGLGVEVPPTLSDSAQTSLGSAHTVIGSARQLAAVKTVHGEHTRLVELPKLSQLKELLDDLTEQPGHCVVLASGDPLFFGIGTWLGKQFSAAQLRFYPGVSSLQAACHRLGLAMQTVQTVSLHGRPLHTLRRHLGRNRTLLLLTDKDSQPQHIAQECCDAGFGQSSITVCENLGYDDERIKRFSVTELLKSHLNFSPLHVSVLEIEGEGGLLPEFPGIPDHFFSTGAEPGKGMISKREVRLGILSLLQPAAGEVIWDVGAGCGGVAVELSRWTPQAQIHAIEHHPERLKHLQINRERFGVTANLTIHDATAPDCLDALPVVDKIFVGGSDGRLQELLRLCWQQLPVGGRLVVSGVIEKTKADLLSFAEALAAEYEASTPDNSIDIEMIEVGVKRSQFLGGTRETIERLPVEIYKFEKLKA